LHPQGNPYAERFMKPLGDALTAYIGPEQANWDEVLPSIIFAYNTRVHSTTGTAPFFMVTGRDARLPSDVIAGLTRSSLRDALDDSMPFAEAMARVYESVRERLENASRKRKIAFDSKQLDVTFEPDNIVMVYSEEAHRKGESTKFISKWKGPFRIVRAIGPVTFRLVHLFTGNETTAHVNRLRKISPYKPSPMADQFAVPTATDNADLNMILVFWPMIWRLWPPPRLMTMANQRMRWNLYWVNGP